ncbi:4'-phosphopantetheinyl transferase superfamily protein [Roseivirga sp. BDSF3-8]|uniref:4'-phosphopantetheinyl transferase family protein n=1 Tax=Roseivirga sp. BDSF3-8 TaxID=3241598 RepID=UPI0035327366
MPLSKIENITGNIWKGYWHLSERTDDLQKMLADRGLPAGEGLAIAHPRRRAEWMAGRLLVAGLLDKAGLEPEPLDKDSYGKPYLHKAPYQPALSHRSPWVVGLLHPEGEAGIDVEKPDNKLKRLSHKFLCNPEREHAADDPERLCIYWAAKETLYKMYGRKGVIFSEQLHIDPFEPGERGLITGHIRMPDMERTVRLHFEKLDELFLVHNL